MQCMNLPCGLCCDFFSGIQTFTTGCYALYWAAQILNGFSCWRREAGERRSSAELTPGAPSQRTAINFLAVSLSCTVYTILLIPQGRDRAACDRCGRPLPARDDL